MLRPYLLTCLSALGAAASVHVTSRVSQDTDWPTVQLQNGTYYGVFNPTYGQDLYLGIPYAQPPVGDLRFRPAQPLNSSWEGERNATEYSPQCFGYGSDTWVLGNYVSEDCLTINVVRPHGVSPDAKLPVVFWIHGGGLFNGGSSDPRYNLSFIVQQSVKMRTPMIGVSINYRLHSWGFLWSNEIQKAGAGNLGFRDQRLALAWVSENIGAFGGDADKVTIWGESAGGSSVGLQIVAYGGRDDGLFRSAIMQSGTGLDTAFNESQQSGDPWQEYYNQLVNKTNCTSAADSLQCLRGVPTWTLSDILNSTKAPAFTGMTDGDFLQARPSDLIKAGNFVRVPVIVGTNYDEGTQFGQKGINTTEQWNAYLASAGASNSTIQTLSALYPDIPSVGLPAMLKGRPRGDLAAYGSQWKRVVSYAGDKTEHAARRWWSRHWAAANLSAYSYHFNTQGNGSSPAQGASHFQEVAFVFDNTQGLGYESVVPVNPFAGKPATYNRLADIMSRMWVSFITDQTPNHNAATCTYWWPYTLDEPQNMAFDVNTSTIAVLEPDTFRTEQIEYLTGKFWGDQLLADNE